ncbi:MAG: DeoR family transcriptional regulator, partial [Phycisphaeraceae bacterium]
MIVHERLKRLRELLTRAPQCPISRMQQELGVSRSTVRRDLLALEEEGVVVRVHGGAVSRDLLQGEETFDRRSRERRTVKRRIAA